MSNISVSAEATLQMRYYAMDQAILVLRNLSGGSQPKAEDLAKYAARIEAYMKEGQ